MLHYNPHNDPRTFCLRVKEYMLPEGETPTGTPVFEFQWWHVPKRQRDTDTWEHRFLVSAPTSEEAQESFRTYQEEHPQPFVDLQCSRSDAIETILDHVCVEDFCGSLSGGMPVSYWADYWFSHKHVVFGGAWYRVPDLPSDTVPTADEVHCWADSHPNDLTDLRDGIRIALCD